MYGGDAYSCTECRYMRGSMLSVAEMYESINPLTPTVATWVQL